MSLFTAEDPNDTREAKDDNASKIPRNGKSRPTMKTPMLQKNGMHGMKGRITLQSQETAGIKRELWQSSGMNRYRTPCKTDETKQQFRREPSKYYEDYYRP